MSASAPTRVNLMKALEVRGAEDMVLSDLPRPEAGPGEVLVRVAYCGICGSDFPRYFDGAVHSTPQTLGHEFSGTIVATGDGVTERSTGQRVAVAPLMPCAACAACEAGRPALCNQYGFVGSRQQGALADYVAVPARNTVPIPDALSLRDAALVEPLTVAIHGVDRASLDPDVPALVFGAGVIGLLTVMVLQHRGVAEVVAVDVHDDKLDLARRFGATATVRAEYLDEYLATSPRPGLVIETAGTPVTQEQSVRICADAGQVVFVGTAHRDVTFPAKSFERLLRGELRVTGSWMSYSAPFPGTEWQSAVELLASAAVPVAELVSREYDLTDASLPFEEVKQSGGRLLKVLYRLAGEEATP